VPYAINQGAAKKCVSPLGRGGTPQYDDGGRLLRESALNGIAPLGEACKSNITENIGKGDRPTVPHQVVPQGRIDGAATSTKAASARGSTWTPNPGAAIFAPATNERDVVLNLEYCAAQRHSEADALLRSIQDHDDLILANRSECAVAAAAVANARVKPATTGGSSAQRRLAHSAAVEIPKRDKRACQQRLLSSHTLRHELDWQLAEARAAAAAATARALGAVAEADTRQVSWDDMVTFAPLPEPSISTPPAPHLPTATTRATVLSAVSPPTTRGGETAGVILPKRGAPLTDRVLHRHLVDSIMKPVEPVESKVLGASPAALAPANTAATTAAMPAAAPAAPAAMPAAAKTAAMPAAAKTAAMPAAAVYVHAYLRAWS